MGCWSATWRDPPQRLTSSRLPPSNATHANPSHGRRFLPLAVRAETRQQGRVWLLLEWRALEEAVLTSGAARKRALADAPAFRRHRLR